MPGFTLDQVRASVQKSAAGRMGQGSASAATSVGGGPSTAVAQDLSVLADQARNYSAGQAVANQQAEAERGQVTAGLAQERGQADTARAETLEAQRREMAVIELARRQAEQEARQEMAAEAQRVELERAEAAERALQARMQADIERRAMAERAAREAEDARQEAALHQVEEERARVRREHGDEHVAVYDFIAQNARNMNEADQVIATMARNGAFGKEGEFNSVRMDIINKDLRRLYGAR